jgi:putative tricarboxylic transport membrane protein
MMEKSLRSTLEMSAGSFTIFFDRPVALALLAIPLVVVVTLLFRPGAFSKLRESDVD